VEGIDYGLSEIKEADLVVGIFDSIDEVLMGRFELLVQGKKYLKVFNKADIQKPKKDVFDYIVSAKTGEGFGLLKDGLASSFKLGEALDSTFLVRERHVKLFNDCVASLDACLLKIEGGLGLELVAEDMKIARSFLDEVVGLKTSDSLLGDIFSSFCIGK
jgi:tRNA modification GTPase